METRVARATALKDRGNALYRLVRGDTLSGRNRAVLEGAVATYTEALSLLDSPEAPLHLLSRIHANRGQALYRLQHFEPAVRDAIASTTYDPSFTKGYVRQGLAYARLGLLRAAAEAFHGIRSKDDSCDSSRLLAAVNHLRSLEQAAFTAAQHNQHSVAVDHLVALLTSTTDLNQVSASHSVAALRQLCVSALHPTSLRPAAIVKVVSPHLSDSSLVGDPLAHAAVVVAAWECGLPVAALHAARGAVAAVVQLCRRGAALFAMPSLAALETFMSSVVSAASSAVTLTAHSSNEYLPADDGKPRSAVDAAWNFAELLDGWLILCRGSGYVSDTADGTWHSAMKGRGVGEASAVRKGRSGAPAPVGISQPLAVATNVVVSRVVRTSDVVKCARAAVLVGGELIRGCRCAACVAHVATGDEIAAEHASASPRRGVMSSLGRWWSERSMARLPTSVRGVAPVASDASPKSALAPGGVGSTRVSDSADEGDIEAEGLQVGVATAARLALPGHPAEPLPVCVCDAVILSGLMPRLAAAIVHEALYAKDHNDRTSATPLPPDSHGGFPPTTTDGVDARTKSSSRWAAAVERFGRLRGTSPGVSVSPSALTGEAPPTPCLASGVALSATDMAEVRVRMCAATWLLPVDAFSSAPEECVWLLPARLRPLRPSREDGGVASPVEVSLFAGESSIGGPGRWDGSQRSLATRLTKGAVGRVLEDLPPSHSVRRAITTNTLLEGWEGEATMGRGGGGTPPARRLSESGTAKGVVGVHTSSPVYGADSRRPSVGGSTEGDGVTPPPVSTLLDIWNVASTPHERCVVPTFVCRAGCGGEFIQPCMLCGRYAALELFGSPQSASDMAVSSTFALSGGLREGGVGGVGRGVNGSGVSLLTQRRACVCERHALFSHVCGHSTFRPDIPLKALSRRPRASWEADVVTLSSVVARPCRDESAWWVTVGYLLRALVYDQLGEATFSRLDLMQAASRGAASCVPALPSMVDRAALLAESSSSDLYCVLGVPQDATHREVKDAYRALVQRYHPDAAAASGDPEDAKRYVERVQSVTRAYTVLSDPEKRERYDCGDNLADIEAEGRVGVSDVYDTVCDPLPADATVGDRLTYTLRKALFYTTLGVAGAVLSPCWVPCTVQASCARRAKARQRAAARAAREDILRQQDPRREMRPAEVSPATNDTPPVAAAQGAIAAWAIPADETLPQLPATQNSVIYLR